MLDLTEPNYPIHQGQLNWIYLIQQVKSNWIQLFNSTGPISLNPAAKFASPSLTEFNYLIYQS